MFVPRSALKPLARLTANLCRLLSGNSLGTHVTVEIASCHRKAFFLLMEWYRFQLRPPPRPPPCVETLRFPSRQWTASPWDSRGRATTQRLLGARGAGRAGRNLSIFSSPASASLCCSWHPIRDTRGGRAPTLSGSRAQPWVAVPGMPMCEKGNPERSCLHSTDRRSRSLFLLMGHWTSSQPLVGRHVRFHFLV